MRALGFLFCLAAAPLSAAWQAQLEPRRAAPGTVVVCSLDGPAPEGLVLAGFQQEAGFYVSGNNAVALLAVPLDAGPGRYRLHLRQGRQSQRLDLRVARDPYPRHRVRPIRSLQKRLSAARSRRETELLEEAEAESDGPPLWRGPFSWPLDGGITVTSPFGAQRTYNRGQAAWRHKGLDLRAQTGTPVLAASSGVVLLARRSLKLTGGTVLLGHGYGVTSAYYHLSRIDVAPGQRVDAGASLGLSGDSGLAAGPHLHWQVALRGRPVDPRQWLEASARQRASAP